MPTARRFAAVLVLVATGVANGLMGYYTIDYPCLFAGAVVCAVGLSMAAGTIVQRLYREPPRA